MNIVYEYANVSASDRLEDLVKEKLEHLKLKYDFLIRGDVFFKKENRSDNSGHICSIRVSLPGPRIHASSDENSFEEAIAETIRDLNDQLERRKDKMKTH